MYRFMVAALVCAALALVPAVAVAARNPGGTGGQHYSEKSQYDVACYQHS